jgi:hypothetical protein
MNIKNITFLVDGDDRKKGERYCVCAYPATHHEIEGDFRGVLKDLEKHGYDIMEYNEKTGRALLKKNTYRRIDRRVGYRYEWRLVCVES